MSIDKIFEDIINDPKNKDTMNKMYQLMVLNNQSWLVQMGTLLVVDYNYPENSGLFAINQGVMIRYDSKIDEALVMRINIPKDWKETVMEFYKEERC